MVVGHCPPHIDQRAPSFAFGLGPAPLTMAIGFLPGNGMAGSFVKTIERVYIAFMEKTDMSTTLSRLIVAFEQDNERHRLRVLKY